MEVNGSLVMGGRELKSVNIVVGRLEVVSGLGLWELEVGGLIVEIIIFLG